MFVAIVVDVSALSMFVPVVFISPNIYPWLYCPRRHITGYVSRPTSHSRATFSCCSANHRILQQAPHENWTSLVSQRVSEGSGDGVRVRVKK